MSEYMRTLESWIARFHNIRSVRRTTGEMAIKTTFTEDELNDIIYLLCTLRDCKQFDPEEARKLAGFKRARKRIKDASTVEGRTLRSGYEGGYCMAMVKALDIIDEEMG